MKDKEYIIIHGLGGSPQAGCVTILKNEMFNQICSIN
jgi:hypothetical protein